MAAGVDEKSVLVRYLDGQRGHLLGALDGLTDQQLATSILPSGWSPIELVNHLALDVELFWFGAVMVGEESAIQKLDEIDSGWRIKEGMTSAEVIARYKRLCQRANDIVSASELDAPPAWWPHSRFGDFHLETNSQVVLHVIAETATHAGHLDIVRKLIDGKQWFVQS